MNKKMVTKWLEGLDQEPQSLKEKVLHYNNLLKKGEYSIEIYQSDETGELVWAISVVEDPGFWMGTFPTLFDAVNFCVEMNWRMGA